MKLCAIKKMAWWMLAGAVKFTLALTVGVVAWVGAAIVLTWLSNMGTLELLGQCVGVLICGFIAVGLVCSVTRDTIEKYIEFEQECRE